MKKIKNLIFVSLAFSPGTGFSYAPKLTHPFMSQSSNDVVQNDKNISPYYSELKEYVQDIRAGSTQEDTGLFEGSRGPLHFYNPITQKGLDTFHVPLCITGCWPSALDTASPLWSSAILKYFLDSNQKSTAYNFLGRVLHLVAQDMAQPSHVQNDPHLPHLSGFLGDASTIDIDSWIGKGFPDNPLPMGDFNLRNPLEFGHKVAVDTHAKSVFLGNLDLESRRGFIDVPGVRLTAKYYEGNLSPEDPSSPYWEIITPEGESLHYYPSITEDGNGFLDSQMQDFWPVRESNKQFFIDNHEKVKVIDKGEKKSLDIFLIQKCAPEGIQYGAGLLKLFHDIVNEPPYLVKSEIKDESQTRVFFNSSGQVFSSLKRDKVEDNSKDLEFDKEYGVNLVFSEPVDNVGYFIGDPNLNKTVQPFLPQDQEKKVWAGSIKIVEPEFSSSTVFSCHDKAKAIPSATDNQYHLNLPGREDIFLGAPIDLDPTTVAHRIVDNSSYPWLDYETDLSKANSGTLRWPCTCDPDIPDIKNPIVELSSTTECSIKKEIKISGTVKDNCAVGKVVINNQEMVLEYPDPLNKRFAKFKTEMELEDGEYSYKAVATDASGNIGESPELNIKVDTKPPQLLSFTPEEGTLSAPLNSKIAATYDEELEAGEIQVSGAEVTGKSQRSGKVLEYVHEGLQEDSTYRVTLAGIKDKCGNESEDFWSFSTSAVNAYITRPDRNDPTTKQWKQVKHIHVEGLISNPEEGATIDVCGDIPGGNLGCQQLTMSPGVKQKWNAEFEIPLEVEGTAKLKMTA